MFVLNEGIVTKICLDPNILKERPMIKKIVTVTFLALIFFVVPDVCASQTLTWQWCVRKAREHNPRLAAERERIEQVAKDKDISLSAALPQIDSSFSVTRALSGDSLSTDYSYGVTARQLLFDGFRTSSDLMRASEELRAQWYNHALVSSNVRFDLRVSFIELMEAREMLRITQGIVDRRKQNKELVQLRYKGGREHKGALLTAGADLAQAEFEVDQAKRNIVVSSRELTRHLGLGHLGSLAVKGDFQLEGEYLQKPDIDLIAETTPFLQEMLAREEAARYNVNVRQADFMPRVYLVGSFRRSDDSWAPRGEDWSGGFSVTLPVFEGGRRMHQVGKALSILRQSGYDTHSGRDAVIVTLERAWKNLKDSVARVEVQKKFLEAAEERARITTAQYSTGLVGFNDWIIIEDNLVRAQKDYISAQSGMLVAEAYWVQAIGRTLEDAKDE